MTLRVILSYRDMKMAVHENGHETLEAFFPYYDQLYPFPVYLSLEAQTPSLLIKKKKPKN